MRYFQHLGTMRHDPKVRRVVERYGIEGYGLYCLIIESITQSIEDFSPLPTLEETCDDIARFYKGNSSRIEEMVNFMCQQKLLCFEPSGEISCHKIYKFLVSSSTRSEKIRGLIKSYKEHLQEQKKIGGMQKPSWLDTYETVCDLSRTVSAIQEETRQNNNNLNNHIQGDDIQDSSESKTDFALWWDNYPKKMNKEKACEAYLRAEGLPSLEEHIQILKLWKKSEQWRNDNGAFIPSAAKWLEDKRWSEIIPIDPSQDFIHFKSATAPHPDERKSLSEDERRDADEELTRVKETLDRLERKVGA